MAWGHTGHKERGILQTARAISAHTCVVPVCHHFFAPDLKSEEAVIRERGDQSTFKQTHPGERVTGFS